MPIVKLSSEEARRRARVDRKRIAATTEKEIARQARADGTVTGDIDFKAGLRTRRVRVLRPLDVATIRAKTGLSQERFAKAFHISPHTLRNWEQGRRVPEGPARALLMAIDRDPQAVMRALQP
jgi:DNA-binding transcriptional regulator YiaG